jgi:membrane fusion protein, multidrug efflux system
MTLPPKTHARAAQPAAESADTDAFPVYRASSVVVSERSKPAGTRKLLNATMYGLGPNEQPPSVSPATEPSPEVTPPLAPAPSLGSRKRYYIPLGVALAVLGLASGVYAWSAGHEDTDDAQVDADISVVAPRVAGTLRAVRVSSHQSVRAGELLAELDPADFNIAVSAAQASLAEADAALIAEQPAVPIAVTENTAASSAARADLNAAQEALVALRREVQSLQAQLTRAEAEQTLADAMLARAVVLERDGALSRAERDAREANARTAAAQTGAIYEGIAAARARVRERESRVAGAQARLSEVQANKPRIVQARQAWLDVVRARRELALAHLQKAQSELSYTQIYAPVAGSICGKLASVGDPVAPGVAVLSVCRTDSLWITANFRETQLQHMRSGQRARVYVDALDLTLLGRVRSIAASTGSRLSLLPPENASGNFVKVVQRIPVRIHLDPEQPGLARLRAGMSVVPSVDVAGD